MAEKTSPVNLPELEPYTKAGYTLMPLHRFDKKSTHNGKEREDGKRPIHNDWTRQTFNNAETIERAREHGNNVGVRLNAGQLVIDVDPRNMKDKDADGSIVELPDTFAQLCEDIGLDPEEFPTVNTGSGGFHLYMSKPENVPVVDSLKDYPGVEFKTRGRQVVAAGSKHPNGKQYEWDFLRPSLAKGVPKAPDRLMDMIRRPARLDGSSGSDGQEHTQQEVAALLDILDPLDYQENDTWLELMMACHHASGGDARSEFIEWSTRDPAYEKDAWLIGRRWDSLTAGNRPDGSVTYKTLHKRVRDVLNADGGKRATSLEREGVDVKAAVTAMQGDPADDFDDDLPPEPDDVDTPEHERKSPLERINDQYWAVSNGGSFRVMKSLYDPVMKREEWQAFKKADFKDFLAHLPMLKYMKDTGRTDKDGEPIMKEEKIAQADAWLQWKKRRTAEGVLFDPSGAAHKGYLNLWRGFAVEPERGSWSYLKELMFEALCAGNQEHFEFLMNWLAYMVKKPHLPAEVAICFRGDKGTGKSTLGEALLRLTGRHGVHATSPKQVTGDFNAHLMECIFLFADEAVGPRDRNAQAAMKSLITDHTKVYEPKGLDIRQGKNHVHVMIASNDDWFVDASVGDGERRYFVSEVAPKYQGNSDFFKRVYGEMEKGGISAMLFDLLAMDLGSWAPREKIPDSTALLDQKLRNMDPMAQWWLKTLAKGEFDFDWAPRPDGRESDVLWELDVVRAFRQDVMEDYGAYCQSLGMRNMGSNKSMGKFFWGSLKKLCQSLETDRAIRIRVPEDRFDLTASKSDGRASAVEFPPLDVCRKELEFAVGGKINWSEWA